MDLDIVSLELFSVTPFSLSLMPGVAAPPYKHVEQIAVYNHGTIFEGMI